MRLKLLAAFLGAALLVPALSAWGQDTVVATDLERIATMSDGEMKQVAVESMAQIERSARTLAKLDEAAGGAGNPDNCVLNNLASGRALLEAMKAATKSFDDALREGRAESARFELRKLVTARDKAGQLVADAERCLRGDGAVDGRTRTQIESGLTDAEGETAALPTDLLDFGFDPPDGSPF